jgi:uncharacterized protein YqiB (DUF1249 family)
MLVDSNILTQCFAGPGSFGGLMALYEANFIKLNQLVSGLRDHSGEQLSQAASDCNLHLTIEARTKYTCELRLTYLFDEGDGPGPDFSATDVADPDLVAKVFFDARMAEVHSWIDSPRHDLLRSLQGRYRRELDLRWSRNIMLSKWLDYLLENGHFFPSPRSVWG